MGRFEEGACFGGIMNIIDLDFVRRSLPMPFGKKVDPRNWIHQKIRKAKILKKPKKLHGLLVYGIEFMTQRDWPEDLHTKSHKVVDQGLLYPEHFNYEQLIKKIGALSRDTEQYRISVQATQGICLHCRRDYRSHKECLFVLKKIYEGFYGGLELIWNQKDLRFVWCVACLARYYPKIKYSNMWNEAIRNNHVIKKATYDECYLLHRIAWKRGLSEKTNDPRNNR